MTQKSYSSFKNKKGINTIPFIVKIIGFFFSLTICILTADPQSTITSSQSPYS